MRTLLSTLLVAAVVISALALPAAAKADETAATLPADADPDAVALHAEVERRSEQLMVELERRVAGEIRDGIGDPIELALGVPESGSPPASAAAVGPAAPCSVRVNGMLECVVFARR
jgi:hypothetical protein